MFDREKQVVINRYCKAIFSETDAISVSKLMNLNLPISIKDFIDREIERIVENEFTEIKKFSKFNFDHPVVKPLVDELKVLLKLNRDLNYDDLSILLKLALDLNMDFLLKPCETLVDFLFKYEDFQSSLIIQERLKYISYYEYFPILIKEYLKRTDVSKISKSDFIKLLYKIEKEYTRDFTILDHYSLFTAFKDFLLEINLFIENYPEYEAFIIYLRDKNHQDLAQFLEENKDHYRAFGGTVLDYLKSIIKYEKLEEKESVGVNEKKFETEQESKVTDYANGTEVIHSDKKSLIDKTFEATIDENKTFETTKESKTMISVETSDGLVTTNQRSELFQKLVAPSVVLEKKVFDRNLDGLMPQSLKKKIIKKIFDNNEFIFNEFMNKMNKVNNWDEASMLLTELFDKKNIQPFSKWAIRLTEFLYDNIR